MGNNALFYNTTGYRNTAVGSEALFYNTTGIGNTAMGNNALFYNTTGIGNTAIGSTAFLYLKSGNYNIGIGASVRALHDSASYQLVIGNYFLGHSVSNSTTQTDYRLGVFGNPDANTQFFVNGSAGGISAWATSSDRRLKDNIADLDYGLQQVMALKPVRYTLKKEPGTRRVGFIAQDVREVIPEVVSGIEGDIDKGETLSIGYSDLIPILAKAIQEQQRTIENLQSRLVALEAAGK
jgi:hypothetical protein